MQLGYRNVHRFAAGWFGWLDLTQPNRADRDKPRGLAVGDFFPACSLVVLQSARDVPYLGLAAGSKRFALREVSADYLVVELYNELCYGCLQAVAAYNQLFDLMTHDPALAGRMKMLGLGVASQHREVVRFRREQGVKFPLFADPKHDVFDCLGKPALPVLYLLERSTQGGYRIVLKHSGHVASPAALLAKLKSFTAVTAP